MNSFNHAWHRAILALLCLAACSSTGSGGRTVYPPVTPPERWEAPGIVIDVQMGSAGTVSAETLPAALPALGGLAGAPAVLINPLAVFYVPYLIVLGPPMQAAFNADAEQLIKTLAATPLPERIVESLRSRWPSGGVVDGSPLHVRVRIAGYGLVTRSGKALEALGSREDLCLVADGQLEVEGGESPARVEPLSISFRAPSSDAPPPLCSPIARLAADDGSLLRQSIGELANALAAMTVSRIQAAR